MNRPDRPPNETQLQALIYCSHHHGTNACFWRVNKTIPLHWYIFYKIPANPQAASWMCRGWAAHMHISKRPWKHACTVHNYRWIVWGTITGMRTIRERNGGNKWRCGNQSISPCTELNVKRHLGQWIFTLSLNIFTDIEGIHSKTWVPRTWVAQ